YRDNFSLAQNVRIAKKDNIKGKGLKDKKGRFLETGKVVAILPEDSYLILRSNGKLQKKRHYDLKELRAANEFIH
ncbi:hypothetical protein COBT_003489, partial [Conglomerata obtusa]